MTSTPDFIVHIGPHKTGTTYLQLSFKAKRAALAERGVLLPEFWEHAPGNPSHLPLAQQLKAGQADLLQPRFDQLLQSGARKVLISAEDLSNLEVPALELLRTLLAGRPVRFVFYFRRWCELIPSSWQESIKQGQTRTLPEFMLLAVQNAAHSRQLNFERKITHFEQVFGAGAMRFVSYSELRDREIDMFTHFCNHFLGWPNAGPGEAPKQANASRDLATTEILRALNSLSKRDDGVASDNLRRAFDALRDREFLAPLIDAIEAHAQKLRFSDGWPSLQALHDGLVAQYHPRLLPPRRPNQLFRPRTRELAYAGAEYMLEPGIADILHALHANLLVVA